LRVKTNRENFPAQRKKQRNLEETMAAIAVLTADEMKEAIAVLTAGEMKNVKINGGEIEKEKKIFRIQVSKTKKPLFFYLNIAKVIMFSILIQSLFLHFVFFISDY